jgi:hypothetical protein
MDIVRAVVSEERVDSIFKVEITREREKCWTFANRLLTFLVHVFFYPEDRRDTSSETSVLTRSARRNILKDGIFHSHRRENLKPYEFDLVELNLTYVLLDEMCTNYSANMYI